MIQETADSEVVLHESDVAGSIVKTEDPVNKILDELLSSLGEDLVGDGTMLLLQERLQINPLELPNLSMPDFRGMAGANYMDIGKSLSKPRRPSIDVQNLVKIARMETPTKHEPVEENPCTSLASPTPPRSPYASISLLKKRILQSNPSRDPFAPLDLSTPWHLSSTSQVHFKPDKLSSNLSHLDGGNIDEKSTEIGESNDRDGAEPMKENVQDVQRQVSSFPMRHDDFDHFTISASAIDGHGSRQMEKHVEERPPGMLPPQMDSSTEASTIIPGQLHTSLEESEVLPQQMDASMVESKVPENPNSGESNSASKEQTTSMQPTGSESYSNQESEKFRSKSKQQKRKRSARELDIVDHSTQSVSKINAQLASLVENDLQVEKTSSSAFSAAMDANIEESTNHETLNGSQMLSEKSYSAKSKECTTGILPTTTESDKKQEAKKLPLKSAQQKTKRSPVGKLERKTLSDRPTIADAGTSFETGVRRSKRIKTRPLEYWKGERLVYGRVNGSLKLIGLKYISPSKNDGELKVKSFISPEYDELVGLAAKHDFTQFLRK